MSSSTAAPAPPGAEATGQTEDGLRGCSSRGVIRCYYVGQQRCELADGRCEGKVVDTDRIVIAGGSGSTIDTCLKRVDQYFDICGGNQRAAIGRTDDFSRCAEIRGHDMN